MNKILFSLLLGSTIFAQMKDELEVLVTHNTDFIYKPENLYKENGLWFSQESKELFTGRVEIFTPDGDKIADCTVINGIKNGYYMQYYNKKHKISGIVGLYMNNLKEGNWTWIDPERIWGYKLMEDWESKLVITIDYSSGIRHGYVSVYTTDMEFEDEKKFDLQNLDNVILEGKYRDGNREGNWFYYDDIYTDYDQMNVSMDVLKIKYNEERNRYWTRKKDYLGGEIIRSECWEPYRLIDCDSYKGKYKDEIYIFIPPDDLTEVIDRSKTTIKSVSGKDVEINVKNFLSHITQYHKKPVNIHRERGHNFKIDDDLRNFLYNKLFVEE